LFAGTKRHAANDGDAVRGQDDFFDVVELKLAGRGDVAAMLEPVSRARAILHEGVINNGRVMAHSCRSEFFRPFPQHFHFGVELPVLPDVNLA
jgi:hypothetical protein